MADLPAERGIETATGIGMTTQVVALVVAEITMTSPALEESNTKGVVI